MVSIRQRSVAWRCMRTMVATAAAFAGTLLAGLAARASSDAGATRFQLDVRGGIVVPVRVNGGGPYRMWLDTGATHSAVTDTLAERVGAPPVAKAEVGSVIGGGLRAVVRLGRLEVGALSVDGLLPSMLPQIDLDPTGTIDGVIGQDVLGSLCYTIDFRTRRVVWFDDPAPRAARATLLPLEPQDGRYVVALAQPGTVLRLVPDSGAETLLLFGGASRSLPPLSFEAGVARLSTLTATRDVRQARVHELHVGTSRLRNLPAVIVDDGGEAAARSDGLLPLHLFERVTFDAPRGQLIVEGTSRAARP